ncbi:hypothetical protein [Anaerotruncus rubiinfantis]|uniref:hypothetical protein n=1 Tax=Anaerotruncus rubiinfantis TaxID=1720200 RepID=UPI0034A143F8
MSITWGEFDSLLLTFEELDQLGITFGELSNSDYPKLLKLAQSKLARFSDLPADRRDVLGPVVPLLENIFSQVAAMLIVDKILNSDWEKLFIEAFKLVQQMFSS